MTLKFVSSTFLIIAMINICSAQVKYLRLSPAQKIVQTVGATQVVIDYSRPQMKERTIFGSLVPFGEMWRTGANENTTISFDHRVRIGQTEISEGKYAIITKPHADNWDIYFYKDTNNLDVPNPFDSSKLIYLTTVIIQSLAIQEESLVINTYNVTETSADLGVSWERTKVMIPITFYTQEAMEKMINKELNQNIVDYSIASSYYAQRDIELLKAKRLRELAMDLKETTNAWDHHEYALILLKLGEEDKAKKNLELSLKLATESDNRYMISENNKLLDLYRK